MLVLGLESSCDESGVALYDTDRGLLAEALHTQVAMHEAYGGVVPELASRDHVRRLLPLLSDVLGRSGIALREVDAIAYTQGPGLAGALLVGASLAESLALALGCPVIPIHHLEGHLLSPLLADPAPTFPFVALLVSGGHTQLMRVDGVGAYQLLGETVDDAAGEAFDKSAKLLGLGYPGGPALARLAESGRSDRFAFPRPMANSGDLNFSFSGLKTAVALAVRSAGEDLPRQRADIARGVEAAIVDVLIRKAAAAMAATGLTQLVVAGGVGANSRLRLALSAKAQRSGFEVFYPPVALCTDNGAMIALAGALRLQAGAAGRPPGSFSVRPRWPLADITLNAE